MFKKKLRKKGLIRLQKIEVSFWRRWRNRKLDESGFILEKVFA